MKKRPILDALISRMEEGDVLIVAALDRLGRRTSELLSLIEDLSTRRIVLKSIREGLDYSTLTGKFMIQVLCAFAEMERNIISERTKIALAAKKKAGVHCGRSPTYSPAKVAQVLELRGRGFTTRAVSVMTGVSASRVSQLSRPKVG